MAYIALSPRGWRPRASVQYIPYIPCARVITITYSYKRVQKGFNVWLYYNNIVPTGTAEIASQYMNHHNYIRTSKVLKSVGRHLVTRPSNLFLTPFFPRWSSLSRTPSHRMTIVSISPHITLPSLTHNNSSGAPI